MSNSQSDLEAEIARLERALSAQTRELERARADVDAIKATRRYRIGAAIARPLDRLRGRRARTSPYAATYPVPFVVGVPRSGTTLLRLMLNAHPDLAIPPETMFIPLLAGLPAAGNLRRAFAHAVTTYDSWPDLGLDAAELERELRRIEPFDVGSGLRAIYRMYAARFDKTRFGDKTPNYGLHTSYIRELLPEARFVHIIRDGRDVAVSVRPLWFRPGDTVEQIAADWRHRIETTRRDRAGDSRYIELRYEDLVAEPESELRRVCDFLELPYHADMACFWEKTRHGEEEFAPYVARDGSVRVEPEARLAHHRATARPIARERAGRWRDELTADERDAFERVAGALLSELGYER
jgi:hypothetical protein